MKSLLCILGIFTFLACSEGVSKDRNEWSDVSSWASFLPTTMEHQYNADSEYAVGGITEEQFTVLVDEIERIYQPIFKGVGMELVFERKYDDPVINAYVNFESGVATVSLFGGLAKHKLMTPDSYALVIVHEIGHVLGGRVRYPNSWASAEGASDSYATQVGARKVFSEISGGCNCGFLPTSSYEGNYKRQLQACEKFNTIDERTVCERTLKGSLELAAILADLGGEKIPTLATMDRTAVRKTQYEHPKASCRLAQYYDGAMSDKKWDDTVIPLTKAQQWRYSAVDRANCWYAGN